MAEYSECMNLKQSLKKYFGHSDFRPGQQAVCESILSGNDTLAVFPTGAGKSLCYQLPAVLLPGLTIVFSPLISLMQDQVEQLTKKEIAATYLSSTLSEKEYQDRLEQVKRHQYQLLYLAPEQLSSAKLSLLLRALSVSLVVVDEAHCISEWGHDFRPSYRAITEKLSHIWPTRPPIAAFTGTATTTTQADIISSLGLNSPQRFTSSLFRKNLQLQILPVTTVSAQEVVVLMLLKKHLGTPTIVYCATRAQTEQCLQLLQRAFGKKYLAAIYHAGVQKVRRAQVQTEFIQNKLSCIIATTAFGMGVDKPDIGCIVHYQLPGSIEQYVQEVGRAGRNGCAAECYLVWKDTDQEVQEEMIRKTNIAISKQQKLTALVSYCNSHSCRHQLLSQYFSESILECKSSCDNCKNQHFSTLKHSDICGIEDLNALANYKQIRERLACQTQVAAEYILTEQQLWWLVVIRPITQKDFLRVPGIGAGWIARWYQPFTQIHDKIHLL